MKTKILNRYFAASLRRSTRKIGFLGLLPAYVEGMFGSYIRAMRDTADPECDSILREFRNAVRLLGINKIHNQITLTQANQEEIDDLNLCTSYILCQSRTYQ